MVLSVRLLGFCGEGPRVRRVDTDEGDVELFNDSLERCQAHPKFLERFYEIFIASDPAVAEKFVHTDLKRQQMMLESSLFVLLEVAGRKPPLESIAHLEHIAERHGRNHLDVRPEMYALWLNCMLQAVSEFDKQFDFNINRAWRTVLAAGIDIMQSKY